MAEHRVSVRLAATGGREVRAEFRGIGEEGSRSFAMVGREIDSLNRRMGGLGLGARNARGAMRNVGLQLSQVAQQGAVTGDYFRALTVQMPDLLLGFGGLGIAIGAAAAVLGPFVIDLFEAADRSKELAESVGALEKAVGAFASRAREAGASTSELVRTYGALAGEARELLAVERDLARLDALEQIAASAEAVRAALGDIGTRTRAEFAQAAARVAEVNAEIERLRAEQRALLREGARCGRQCPAQPRDFDRACRASERPSRDRRPDGPDLPAARRAGHHLRGCRRARGRHGRSEGRARDRGAVPRARSPARELHRGTWRPRGDDGRAARLSRPPHGCLACRDPLPRADG
ncbi:hypothetical protein ACFOHS_14625 [Jhaorihella thermophila]